LPKNHYLKRSLRELLRVKLHKIPITEITGIFMSISTNRSFPKVKGSNLNGDSYNLPKDLKGTFNIIIIAFRREQTEILEGWATALDAVVSKDQPVEYYELPVLSASYSPLRWWIDGGMRAGIVDQKSRDRTITLYTNKSKFKNQMGIPDEETVYVFLIDKEGNIFWRTEGNVSQQKISELQKILNETSPSRSSSGSAKNYS
jgi:hypothetical protein